MVSAAAGPSSAPPSSITFPVSDPISRTGTGQPTPVPHVRPPHLPFRRISLPTAPSSLLQHRESVVSVASFDSLPEEGPLGSASVPAVLRNVQTRAGAGAVAGRAAARPPSVESPRRRRRREHAAARPHDEAKARKRRKVVEEFYETERTYLDGLELIYSHFLTPIIASLDSPSPLLRRSDLTAVFSNFIDIWNLHRSFFSSLSSLLANAGIPSSAESTASNTRNIVISEIPPLSSILLSHFPYLSLYNLFVTSFPTMISSLTDLSVPSANQVNSSRYNPAFASFLTTQEADPRCGKLKLRDWLLTVVQRCPRYLLLLKDLIQCTDLEDPEHAQLTAAHELVSKITSSLNTSLHTHAQTLALLALQRSTPNLPFQLVVPGRTFLKRGPLLQVERSSPPREREFLLFSDFLVWLAAEESERAWRSEWVMGVSAPWTAGAGSDLRESDTAAAPAGFRGRSPLARNRSKSEAELRNLDTPPTKSKSTSREKSVDSPSPSTPTTPSKYGARGGAGARKVHHPPPNLIRRHASTCDERWVYKGRAELVDLEVVVSPSREPGDERRFEVLSPEGSFVLYANTEAERDEWSMAIRQAKAQWLVSLNVTRPNSTLTSSSSTNHLRRSLQALPFHPSDDRLATVRESRSEGHILKGKVKGDSQDIDKDKRERRRKVDHWVPAIWIPDDKTSECMRCGRAFGWRRRRHHCRLCGRCVCASCSSRTFFISDQNTKGGSSKPARACDACYETVFPVLDSSTDDVSVGGASEHMQGQAHDTITSLSNLPTWLSMPSLPVSSASASMSTAHALMAIDREPLGQIGDAADGVSSEMAQEKRARVRMRAQSRPKSYHQILEDFEDRAKHGHASGVRPGFVATPLPEREGEDGEEDSQEDREMLDDHRRPSVTPTPTPSPRKENTARRHKRFSLPAAVALHTTSVTTRTNLGDLGVHGGSSNFGAGASGAGGGAGQQGGGAGASPSKLSKRFSLVLGAAKGPQHQHHHHPGSSASRSEGSGAGGAGDGGRYGESVAVEKLNELLNRRNGAG